MPISMSKRYRPAAGNLTAKTLTLFIAALSSLSVLAEPLLPYQATYTTRYNSIPLTLTRELKHLGDQWTLTQRGEMLFVSLDEQAQFTLENQHVTALSYRYRDRKIDFDWPRKTVRSERKKEAKQLPLNGPSWDPLSFQLQVRLDAMASGNDYQSRVYDIVSGHHARQYEVSFLGEEVLATAVGPLNTIKLKQHRVGKDSYNVFWLARDWQYLIVRTESYGEDDAAILELKDATLNGKAVQGVKLAESTAKSAQAL